MSIKYNLTENDILISHYSVLKHGSLQLGIPSNDKVLQTVGFISNELIQTKVDKWFDLVIKFQGASIKVLNNYCYYMGDVYHKESLPDLFPQHIKDQILTCTTSEMELPSPMVSDDYVLLYLYNEYDKEPNFVHHQAVLYVNIDKGLRNKHSHHFECCDDDIGLYSESWFKLYHNKNLSTNERLKDTDPVPLYYIQRDVDTFSDDNFEQLLNNHNSLYVRRLIAMHCKNNAVLNRIKDDEDKEVQKNLKQNPVFK